MVHNLRWGPVLTSLPKMPGSRPACFSAISASKIRPRLLDAFIELFASSTLIRVCRTCKTIRQTMTTDSFTMFQHHCHSNHSVLYTPIIQVIMYVDINYRRLMMTAVSSNTVHNSVAKVVENRFYTVIYWQPVISAPIPHFILYNKYRQRKRVKC